MSSSATHVKGRIKAMILAHGDADEKKEVDVPEVQPAEVKKKRKPKKEKKVGVSS